MSNELLEKAVASNTHVTGNMSGSAVATTGVHIGSEGEGGLLNPEQSARFLDYMFDATVIGKVARTVRMRADTTEIDRMSVGEKLMVLATEADTTGGNSAVSFSKISLTTKKLRLDWELSTESLEDNIEGPDLEDHIARMMATQAGNDIEDVLLNGNTALSSDNLYKAFDGVVKKAKTYGHVVDNAGAAITRASFNSALKSLPRKYKIKGFETKHILKDVARSLVPAELIDRPKMGFGIPRAEWLRTGMREMVVDTLTDSTATQRGWFISSEVKKVIDIHMAGEDKDNLIWPMLMLELWARTWLD